MSSLVIGQKYVPIKKSIGRSLEASAEWIRAKQLGNGYLFYTGVHMGGHAFSSYQSEEPTGDYFEEGDVIPFDEPAYFEVWTYSTHGDEKSAHWSDGLKMLIKKNGVEIRLDGKEVEKIVKSLPKTIGGTY